MQKIWISGAGGQLGRAINRVVDNLEYEMLDTDIDDLDITCIEDVLSFGEINRPDIIINCSGMTDLKICEENPRLAYKVNALGARNLSIIAKKLEAKLVQISTDDVFDGTSTSPYNEFDATNPLTIYGKSKLAGENYVKEFTSRHFIIRSSWVYGEGENFVLDLLKKVEEKKPLAVASDQFGSPTSASELAEFILHLVSTSEYGTYHATNRGICSRFEFASEILRLTGKRLELKPVSASELGVTELRPAYAVLDNFIMSIIDIYDFPDWRISLDEYIKEGNF